MLLGVTVISGNQNPKINKTIKPLEEQLQVLKAGLQKPAVGSIKGVTCSVVYAKFFFQTCVCKGAVRTMT